MISAVEELNPAGVEIANAGHPSKPPGITQFFESFSRRDGRLRRLRHRRWRVGRGGAAGREESTRRDPRGGRFDAASEADWLPGA